MITRECTKLLLNTFHLQSLAVLCQAAAHFGFTWPSLWIYLASNTWPSLRAGSGNFFNAFKDFRALSLTTPQGGKTMVTFSIFQMQKCDRCTILNAHKICFSNCNILCCVVLVRILYDYYKLLVCDR